MEFLIVALFGVSFGSFLNVLIIRIPNQESIIFPASHCRSCKKRVKIVDNIPILSYILLRGECRFCKAKISPIYPVVEFSTMALFLIIYIKLGINLDSILVAVIFSLLFALSIIDMRYRAVPDSLNLTALTLAIFTFDVIESFQNALLFAGGFALLRFYLSFIVKREAMGEGDIILAGTIGALLGVELALFAIFLSSLLALPVSLYFRVKESQIEIAYIPFLAISTLIVSLFDREFHKLYQYLYH